MKSVVIFFSSITIIFFLSCTDTGQKKQTKEVKDDFYIKERGLDNIRLPLIKPYEVLRLNGAKEWIMNLEANTLQFSISNVKELNVIDSVIIVHSVGITYLRGENVPDAWFIIKPSVQVEQGFADKKEFLLQLKKYGISEPKFYDIDFLYNDFVKNSKLKW